MKKNISKILIILILSMKMTASLAFPKVNPDIKIAPIQTPENWFKFNSFITNGDPIINWWDQFNDPQLSSYINDITKFNYDLLTAIARIQETRALRAGAESNLFPNIDSNAKFSRYQLFAAKSNTSTNFANIYFAGFDASWEIDFFGKKRWDIISATERIEEAKENKRAILISLISEVARNYMELRGYQCQLSNLKQNIEVQSKSVKLIRSKYIIGLAPQIDLDIGISLLESLKSQIPSLEASIIASAYNISVLTGRNPEVLLNELLPEKPLPLPVNIIATGLPADLILRRPDIRRAQSNLAAIYASVGAAKADLYPAIKLNGTFGFQKATVGKLIDFNGGLWSVSPSVNWKILDRRSLKSKLDANKAKLMAADTELRQTVLESIKDVDTSINNLLAARQTEKELTSATLSSKKVFIMTDNAYKIGLKSQFDKLDAEKTYINNKSQLIENQTQINLLTIKLYKALGGGWQCF